MQGVLREGHEYLASARWVNKTLKCFHHIYNVDVSSGRREEWSHKAPDFMNEWLHAEHASAYLQRADDLPYRATGEAVLLEELAPNVRRVLDLGSGDGRLLALVLRQHPDASGVAMDFSPHMLRKLRARFAERAAVEIVDHDLAIPLPALGRFDTIVSSFAIHHLTDRRKRALYAEIWDRLLPGGVFCNLEHVASASVDSHLRFLTAIGSTPDAEDPSNKLVDVHHQLVWLRRMGFSDVDCCWKWRELALLVGRRRV